MSMFFLTSDFSPQPSHRKKWREHTLVHVISEKKTCWKGVGQHVFFGFCVESQLKKSFKQNGNLRGANERVVFNLFFF
jgi:hypothetical protein